MGTPALHTSRGDYSLSLQIDSTIQYGRSNTASSSLALKSTLRLYYLPFGSGMLTAFNIGEDVEPQELSFFAGENARWYSHLEDSLTVSYKTKYSNPAPWYLLGWRKIRIIRQSTEDF